MSSDADRSIGTILGDVAGNIQHIVGAEMRLARAEVRDELKKITRGTWLLAVAFVAAVLGLGIVLLAGVYGLATVMAPWAAALVVGVTTIAVAGISAIAGTKRMRRVALPPPRTVQTIKETLKWAKTRAN